MLILGIPGVAVFTLRPYQIISVLCILGITAILLDLFVYKPIDATAAIVVGQPYVPEDDEYPLKKRWMLRVSTMGTGPIEKVETTHNIWKRCKEGDIVLVGRKQSLIFGRVILERATRRLGFD